MAYRSGPLLWITLPHIAERYVRTSTDTSRPRHVEWNALWGNPESSHALRKTKKMAPRIGGPFASRKQIQELVLVFTVLVAGVCLMTTFLFLAYP
jgi:hypothetical protein